MNKKAMAEVSPRAPRKFLGISIPSFTEGSFARNQSYMMGRNIVALLIQITLTPIIVRLYDPEAYGTMNAIVSLSALLVPFFTLQYDRALLLAQDEGDIQGLRTVSNFLPLTLSVGLFVLLLSSGDKALVALGLPALGSMALWIPVLIVLSAWAQVGQQMVAVRMKYKASFLYGSLTSLGSKLTAIGHGVLVSGSAMGLVAAELFSRIAQIVVSTRFILKEKSYRKRRKETNGALGPVLRKYIGFPKFELPAVGIAALANQVPLWWIPQFHGLAAFGQYGLSLSLLEIPMRMFGYSLSSTFYQKAAKVYATEGARPLLRITLRTMGFVAAASAIPLLAILLWAEPLFAFVFGADWSQAGRFASALTVMYAARLIAEPISSVLRVVGRQRIYMAHHALVLVARVSALMLAHHWQWDIIPAITLYAVADAFTRAILAGRIILILRRLSAQTDSGNSSASSNTN